jgi:hypothetical protein
MVPVNVLEFGGQRYLVTPRRDNQWVRNLRAPGRGASRALGLPGSALLQGAVESGRSPGVQDRATVTER